MLWFIDQDLGSYFFPQKRDLIFKLASFIDFSLIDGFDGVDFVLEGLIIKFDVLNVLLQLQIFLF